jgi:hypothetical protein
VSRSNPHRKLRAASGAVSVALVAVAMAACGSSSDTGVSEAQAAGLVKERVNTANVPSSSVTCAKHGSDFTCNVQLTYPGRAEVGLGPIDATVEARPTEDGASVVIVSCKRLTDTIYDDQGCPDLGA